MNTLKLGKYKHYKGKEYEVIGVAKHSETLKDLVVYKALHDSSEYGKDALWVRPLSAFTGIVPVQGKKISRFTYIKE